MNDGTRFELRLSAERRRQLAALAAESGLSAAHLARLGIKWLLDHPGALLQPEAGALDGRPGVAGTATAGTACAEGRADGVL